MAGDSSKLRINGYDAWATYHVSMDNTTVSALMAPAPLKGMIENRSRLENGVRRIRTGRTIDSRELRLGFNLWANSDTDYRTYYNKFVSEVLNVGKIDIQIPQHMPNTEYHCDFLSCSSFSVHGKQLSKLVLVVVESDPSSRTITSTNH